MKRIISAAAALAALAFSQQAFATDFCVGSVDFVAVPGSGACGVNPNQQAANSANNGLFDVTTDSGSIFIGPINAGIAHFRLNVVGTFTDRFFFTIPQTGNGSGSLTSTATGTLLTGNDVDFNSVILFNGFNNYVANLDNTTNISTAGLNVVVPIYTGIQNILSVTYTKYAASPSGRYDGNLQFVPVPEPTTWAMMLAGFGAIGFSMRRRRKPQPKVRFAF